MSSTSFMEDALCSETGPDDETWFGDTPSYSDRKLSNYRDAISICNSCLVIAECLEYALDEKIRFGVWGGVSPNMRDKLLARSKS